jgi:hypothetical protein
VRLAYTHTKKSNLNSKPLKPLSVLMSVRRVQSCVKRLLWESIAPPPSEQGATHELQTPLGAEQFRHQVPHTQPLPVPMHTVQSTHQRTIKGETKWKLNN